MNSSRAAIDEFFKSTIWEDIEEILQIGLDEGHRELEQANLTDLQTAACRGRLYQIRQLLNLEAVFQSQLEEQDENGPDEQ